MRSVSCSSLVALLLAATLATPASADGAAGMVLKVSGATEPTVVAYAEVAENAPVRIDNNGRLTIVHYRSCEIVTVAGGTVMLTAAGVREEGGTVESRAKRPCPREHRLTDDGKSSGGAIVSRAMRQSRMPVRPTLVLAGARAERVRGAKIRGEAATEARSLSIDGRQLRWRSDDAPLVAGQKYVLVLALEGDDRPLELPFTAVEVEGGGESATFDIVRVD